MISIDGHLLNCSDTIQTQVKPIFSGLTANPTYLPPILA